MAANTEAHTLDPETRLDRIEANLEHASRLMMEYRKDQRETDRQLKETDRQLKEDARRAQEDARRMQEDTRRLKKEGKKTDRRLRRAENLFTTQWGKLMESLVRGDLIRLLKERRIEVEGTARETEKARNGEHFEIDIIAINGSELVAVEVKTTLRSEGVTHFLGKLERFLEWWPEFQGRRIYGAVAYLQSSDSVVKYAQRRGLFVIRATGSSASIVNPDDFEPRIFS